MTRRTYSGRTEVRTPPETPNLSKVPALRAALIRAADAGQLPDIAAEVGCKSEVLKPFASGNAVTLPSGVKGRVIAALMARIDI